MRSFVLCERRPSEVLSAATRIERIAVQEACPRAGVEANRPLRLTRSSRSSTMFETAVAGLTLEPRRHTDGRCPPNWFPPMHSVLAKPFHRDGWVYEEKVDGWRIVAIKDGRFVRLVSRTGKDHAERFPDIA